MTKKPGSRAKIETRKQLHAVSLLTAEQRSSRYNVAIIQSYWRELYGLFFHVT